MGEINVANPKKFKGRKAYGINITVDLLANNPQEAVKKALEIIALKEGLVIGVQRVRDLGGSEVENEVEYVINNKKVRKFKVK